MLLIAELRRLRDEEPGGGSCSGLVAESRGAASAGPNARPPRGSLGEARSVLQLTGGDAEALTPPCAARLSPHGVTQHGCPLTGPPPCFPTVRCGEENPAPWNRLAAQTLRGAVPGEGSRTAPWTRPPVRLSPAPSCPKEGLVRPAQSPTREGERRAPAKRACPSLVGRPTWDLRRNWF